MQEWNGPTPTENRHSKLQRTDAVPTTNYQISPAKSVQYVQYIPMGSSLPLFSVQPCSAVQDSIKHNTRS